MTCGWAGKILDVDLTTREVGTRDTMDYASEYIGGRALAARIAWDEIPAGIDASRNENRIIIATGPLTGTLVPTSGRTIMGSLSPRVYPKAWYTHSTLGGWFGPELKYAGFDAIVIRGRASSPVYLDIRDNVARLCDARELWGSDARTAQLHLKAHLGHETQVLTIGPAGENLVRFATVQHAEENAAGHSGFGAVWGSKNLKAIAVRGTGGTRVARPRELLNEVLSMGKFKSSPCSAFLFKGATRKRRPICSQACTFNCTVGSYGRTVDERVIPTHCIGGVWVSDADDMRGTQYSGGGLHVPPGRNFGLCEEVMLHELCNSLGLDLWFRLVMQPWLVRCRQMDIRQIRGHAIEPSDVFWFERFMHQIAVREGLGAVFAEDLVRAMDELEDELPDELVTLGRQLEFGFGFPAHREGRFWDEEPLPFWVISAMMYASSNRDPTIGTHQSSMLLADFLLEDRELARRQFRVLSEKVWGDPNALEPTFENKAPVAIWSQHQHVLIDTLPLCDFAFPQLVRPMETIEEWRSANDISGDLELDQRFFSAVTGVDMTRPQMSLVAERGFTLERLLLARAGRTRRMEEALAPHFQLPCRADGTSTDEAGFSRLLDEYYAARGWDNLMGWPQAGQLRDLGLGAAIPEMESLRQTHR